MFYYRRDWQVLSGVAYSTPVDKRHKLNKFALNFATALRKISARVFHNVIIK